MSADDVTPVERRRATLGLALLAGVPIALVSLTVLPGMTSAGPTVLFGLFGAIVALTVFGGMARHIGARRAGTLAGVVAVGGAALFYAVATVAWFLAG